MERMAVSHGRFGIVPRALGLPLLSLLQPHSAGKDLTDSFWMHARHFAMHGETAELASFLCSRSG